MRYTPMRCTPMRYTPVTCTPAMYTPMRHTPMRYTPVRCTPVRYTPMRLLQTVVRWSICRDLSCKKRVFALVARWSLWRAYREPRTQFEPASRGHRQLSKGNAVRPQLCWRRTGCIAISMDHVLLQWSVGSPRQLVTLLIRTHSGRA